MGDPRKIRKTYAKPRMIWNDELLKSDKELTKEYALKNKKEIWKVNAILGNIKKQAKYITSMLSTAKADQALRQKELLITKVKRLGIIKKEEVTLGDMLTLSVRDIMERRLQTLLFRKKLARTTGQARQFIVHGHVMVNGKKITSPSYLVPVADEEELAYVEKSPLNAPTHPERADVDPNIVVVEKEAKAEEAPAEEAKEEAPAEEVAAEATEAKE